MRYPACSYRLLGGLIAGLLMLAGSLTPAHAAINDSLPDGLPITPDSLFINSDNRLLVDTLEEEALLTGLLVSTPPKDSLAYKPDPTKAIWYSAIFPGLGQIYNRRYWKLPIVAAGVVGITYAIGWNSKYYVAYTNAYRDITDNKPHTQSYLTLLPPGTTNFNTAQLTTILKNRQQKYRRSRDLSFIGAVGVYIICILDAYVDAHLYDFDISPDLSLNALPTAEGLGTVRTVELSLLVRF